MGTYYSTEKEAVKAYNALSAEKKATHSLTSIDGRYFILGNDQIQRFNDNTKIR